MQVGQQVKITRRNETGTVLRLIAAEGSSRACMDVQVGETVNDWNRFYLCKDGSYGKKTEVEGKYVMCKVEAV